MYCCWVAMNVFYIDNYHVNIYDINLSTIQCNNNEKKVEKYP